MEVISASFDLLMDLPCMDLMEDDPGRDLADLTHLEFNTTAGSIGVSDITNTLS